MKKFLLLLMMASFVMSCSSDDAPALEITPDTLTLNGEAVTITNKQYFREFGNSYFLKISTNIGADVIVQFDKYGNFMQIQTGQLFEPPHRNFPYFSGHFFEFEMTPINMSQGSCVIDFAGNAYLDRLDRTSVSTAITGHINLESATEDPGPDFMYNRGLYAKVGAKDWLSTGPVFHIEDSAYLSSHYVCDDEYRVVITLSESNPQIGEYTFTPSASYNCIKIQKYDIATDSYTTWQTSGNLRISEIIEPYQYGFYATGTFNATATNPENPTETVTFANGVIHGLKL